MKKTGLFFFVILTLFSCSNELDINAEWKETPIIYGMLNPDSTRQIIKLYKSFLDENTSALELAQNPDSIYYTDDVELVIEKKSSGERISLVKTDAALLGMPMQEGIFAHTPNIVYLFNHPIDPNETYVIRFFNPRTGKTAFAETRIVNDFQINAPLPASDINFASPNNINIQWRSAKFGKVYDVVMRFTYEEWHVSQPGQVQVKSIDWNLAKGMVSAGLGGGEQLTISIRGKEFFNFIRSQLVEDSELRRRAVNRPISLYFYTGGEELYNFIRVNQAQSGITSLQTLPEYTNVEGGLGIFSSRRFKVRNDLGLTPLTLDSLSCGAITRGLNFVNASCF